MARNLLCPDCNEESKGLANRYSELYESVAGKSKGEFLCDGCYPAKTIHIGDLCYASVLLPNKEHFNYEIQKPEVWMNNYLNPLQPTTIK